ncbi:MAG TPA: ABC transporter substrate-binding protein [Candidatus Binatia bacterium]|nr:ABC transporter substrate-binding protein [Candidatus Binatia bacterium]
MKPLLRATCLIVVSLCASSIFAAERITAAYTSIAAAYAPFWVAKDKGIFDKYNFDTRLIYMRGTVPTLAALANSELDFVQSGASPFIPYAAKGGDVVLLGCLANKVIDYVLIAHPSITRIEQLRGKPIGISRVGDQTHHYVREILKRYGISLKEVRLVQTGLQPERVAALRQGLTMASILNRPNNLPLEKEGYKRLLDIEDLKLPAGVRCLITTKKIMKAKPAMVDNFVMAWLESVRYILTQKRETKEVISKYTRNTNDVDLEEAWNTLATQTEIPPYASVSQLQGQANMMAEDQPDLARFDAKVMVDNSVIKKLEDSGWTKKLFGK